MSQDNDYVAGLERVYPFALIMTRLYIVGLGFGLGWLASKLFTSPEAAWWAFWTPAALFGTFALSGFIADVIPLPRLLINVLLLGAAAFYACSGHVSSAAAAGRYGVLVGCAGAGVEGATRGGGLQAAQELVASHRAGGKKWQSTVSICCAWASSRSC
jgi:hypothetical protein